jgi:phage pi2 protein 07
MKKVGQAKWNTAWHKGEDSDVMEELVKQDKLPKELETSAGGSGYYTREVSEDYNFEIRRL